MSLPDVFSAAEVTLRGDGRWVRLEDYARKVDTLRAQLEAAEGAVQRWMASAAAQSGYAHAAEARAEAAEAGCAAMRSLIVPGLRVYKGDYVMQIDAGKVGLFTERYADEADLPRAIRAAQDRAIEARTKEQQA